MDYTEPVFEEDKDVLVNQDEQKFMANLKHYRHELSQQLLQLNAYLIGLPNRHRYINMFGELDNISNMNTYMLFLALRYYETFGILRPDVRRPETSLEAFLQDDDKYIKILTESSISKIAEKNTLEFRFNAKIGLASYLKFLEELFKR